jgi:hypothetical protein
MLPPDPPRYIDTRRIPTLTGPDLAGMTRGRVMQAALTALLDHAKGARKVLPHLAALENALGKKGLDVLDTISQPVLTKMYTQLSSLPLGPGDVALNELLSHLMHALERLRPERQYLSDFMVEDRLSVGEATLADFDAALRAMRTQQP